MGQGIICMDSPPITSRHSANFDRWTLLVTMVAFNCKVFSYLKLKQVEKRWVKQSKIDFFFFSSLSHDIEPQNLEDWILDNNSDPVFNHQSCQHEIERDKHEKHDDSMEDGAIVYCFRTNLLFLFTNTNYINIIKHNYIYEMNIETFHTSIFKHQFLVINSP